MNLSETKEFVLTDIEETNGIPVAVTITRLSPKEVDEILRAAGTINVSEVAKFSFLAEKLGFKLDDLAKDSAKSEEEKGKIMLMLLGAAEEAGLELPTALLDKKRTAVETHNLLKDHIVGWSGIFNDDGKPVPVTDDYKDLVLTAMPAIVKDKIVEAIEHLTQHGVLPGEESSSPI